MPRKARTVQQVCIAKLGVHRGAVAAARIAQYAIATRELGHVPTTEEYSEYWAVAERTAWLHRRAVRDVFGDDNWRQVVEQVAAEIDRGAGSLSPRRVMDLPAPRLVTA